VTLIWRYVNQIPWRYPTGFVLDLDHTAPFENEVPLMSIMKVRFGLAAGIDLKVIDKFQVGPFGLLRQRPARKKLIDSYRVVNGRGTYIFSRRDFHNFVRQLVRWLVIPRALNDGLALGRFPSIGSR
jgi:hypothetical protein